MGVLIAPPGAGKTVMGCYAIAKRNVPTLILAHRKPILDINGASSSGTTWDFPRASSAK
jgi:hypothetical protein